MKKLGYFEDIYAEDGHQPEEPQRAISLTPEEVLRFIVMPDQQGRYHFDEMGNENLSDYLGHLVGYLSSPLLPSEAAHYQNQQAQQEYLCKA